MDTNLRPRVLRKLLATKGELVCPLPARLLPHKLRRTLRRAPGLAIVEIEDRGSVDASLRALKRPDVGSLLPTFVYSGTEFGCPSILERRVTLLRRLAGQRYRKRVHQTLLLGSPRLFRVLLDLPPQLAGATLLRRIYGHALRLPLASELHASLLVTGANRDDDPRALDTFRDFAAFFSVELFQPMRTAQPDPSLESVDTLAFESILPPHDASPTDSVFGAIKEHVVPALTRYVHLAVTEGHAPVPEAIIEDEV